MTTWTAPAPGPWQQDSAHTPVSQSTIMQEVYPPGFHRGFSETFSRYGVLLDRLAMASVNGFTYHQPQPFDMPGPDGPMPPDAINAEFGKRLGLAAETFETKRWRQDLQDWDNEWKPGAISTHRAFSDVDLANLDDVSLLAHVSAVGEHVSEMVYQHHRFNMAAILPVGDFALHACGWTGRPPHEMLAALDGHSTVSGALPDEMRAAVEAIRANADAQQLLHDDGEPAQRLATLRGSVPEVDEYVRSVDCRLVDGFDIVNVTIRERPEIVLGKLAAGLDADPEQSGRRSAAFADELRASLPVEHQAEFDELLGDARANYRLRDERGIYSDVSAIGLLRLGLLEVGARAQERGHIADIELVLDASLAEVPLVLSGPGLSETLAQRADHRRQLTADGPPRFLGSPPPPPPSMDELPPPLARLMSGTGFMIESILGQLEAAAGDSSLVAGLAGNSGICEGTARLVESFDDLFELVEGEIVVTSSTSEAFNSVLHLVGAIVTDHGSHACHAAIVAREMGFPAVVGTVDGTKRIRTGDRIRVDGTKGEVQILS